MRLLEARALRHVHSHECFLSYGEMICRAAYHLYVIYYMDEVIDPSIAPPRSYVVICTITSAPPTQYLANTWSTTLHIYWRDLSVRRWCTFGIIRYLDIMHWGDVSAQMMLPLKLGSRYHFYIHIYWDDVSVRRWTFWIRTYYLWWRNPEIRLNFQKFSTFSTTTHQPPATDDNNYES